MKKHKSLSLLGVDSINLIINTSASVFIEFIKDFVSNNDLNFNIEYHQEKINYNISKDGYFYKTLSTKIQLNIFSSYNKYFVTPSIKVHKSRIYIQFAGILDYTALCYEQIWFLIKTLNERFENSIKITRMDLCFDFRVKNTSDLNFSSKKYSSFGNSDVITTYHTKEDKKSIQIYSYNKSIKACYPSLNEDQNIFRLEFSLRDCLKKTNFQTLASIDKSSIEWLEKYLGKHKLHYTFQGESKEIPIAVLMKHLKGVFDYVNGKQEYLTVDRSKFFKMAGVIEKRDQIFEFLEHCVLSEYKYQKCALEKVSIQSLNSSALLKPFIALHGKMDKSIFNRSVYLYLNKEKTRENVIKRFRQSKKMKRKAYQLRVDKKLFYLKYMLHEKHLPRAVRVKNIYTVANEESEIIHLLEQIHSKAFRSVPCCHVPQKPQAVWAFYAYKALEKEVDEDWGFIPINQDVPYLLFLEDVSGF